MLNYNEYISKNSGNPFCREKEPDVIFTIDRELLMNKANEVRSVLGNAIHNGLYLIYDLVMTQRGGYTTRWSENVPVPMFLPYVLIEQFATKTEKSIQFTVNNGEITDVTLID